MDVYKGTGAFSGIAIGKILYYHKSEYQMRQYEITDVKTELNIFRQARTRVMEQLEDLYEKNNRPNVCFSVRSHGCKCRLRLQLPYAEKNAS